MYLFWFCKSKLGQRETKNLYQSIVSKCSASVLWVKPLMPVEDLSDLFLTLKLVISEMWFPPSTTIFVSEAEQQKIALFICLMTYVLKKKNLPPFLQLIFNIYLSLSTFSCLWCRQLVPKQTNWGVSKHQPAGRLQLLTGSEDSPSSNELKKYLLGFFFFFLNLRLSTSLLMSQFNYLFKNVMVFTASRDYISSFY